VCRLHVDILPAIQMHQFCEMCWGIMNNPIQQVRIDKFYAGFMQILLMICLHNYLKQNKTLHVMVFPFGKVNLQPTL
jgi:hypothetical protein